MLLNSLNIGILFVSIYVVYVIIFNAPVMLNLCHSSYFSLRREGFVLTAIGIVGVGFYFVI